MALSVCLIPGWANAVVDCGDTLELNGQTVVLNHSIDQCDQDPALTVIGPGTFDMNGYKIDCETSSLDGLVIEGKRVTVKNGKAGIVILA